MQSSCALTVVQIVVDRPSSHTLFLPGNIRAPSRCALLDGSLEKLVGLISGSFYSMRDSIALVSY